MANGQLSMLLEFVNLQMAAEAFLLRSDGIAIEQLTEQQLRDRLIEGNTHASHAQPIQAEQFVTQFQVLKQFRNDPMLSGGAGFSATLFKNNGIQGSESFPSRRHSFGT